jgi:hypothetical protein
MRRLATGALLVTVLAVATASQAAKPASPQAGARAEKAAVIKQLRQEIKVLKEEEKAAIKIVQGQFQPLISGNQLTEKEVQEIRNALGKQQKVALAMTTDPAKRKVIRAEFDAVRALLRTDGKLEKAQIKQLKEQEKTVIFHIKGAYGARIQALEANLHALSGK